MKTRLENLEQSYENSRTIHDMDNQRSETKG